MIKRFIKVVDGLYRGSAPTTKDVIKLKKDYGINKIVSLDERAGNRIKRITKLMNITHIILPINANLVEMSAESLLDLFSYNLNDLLIQGGPTFVHSIEGKDRTGMVIAMFKCKYLGVPYEEAIEEAKKLGFGIGLDPIIIKLFSRAIKLYCSKKDESDINDLDIVDNSRPSEDSRGSVLDEADMKSFAPFLDSTRQYPFNQVDNPRMDQYPTRNNLKEVAQKLEKKYTIPIVGLYESEPLGGVGPVEMGAYKQI